MAEPINHRVLLAQRTEGLVRQEDFLQDVQPIPEPADGEVLVRGETVMPGYRNLPEVNPPRSGRGAGICGTGAGQ